MTTIRVKLLDPDLVRPDLDPNCLRRLAADAASRQRVVDKNNSLLAQLNPQ